MGEIDQNEVAALNERWRSEDRQNLPAQDRIADGASIAGPAIVAGTAILATGGAGAAGLAIAGGVVAGLNLFDNFLRLGDSTIKENVRELAEAVEAGFMRLERKCIENGRGVDELKAQLGGEKFREGTAILVLHALRTKNKMKLDRLAQVLVSGVANDDLEPETLDDMMRAAVELKERDILALAFICSRQSTILEEAEKWPEQWYDKVRRDWQASVFAHGIATQQAGSNDVGLKSSLARLAAFGFIIGVPPVNTTNSPGKEPYALLHDGKRFYERLQETGNLR